MRAVVSSHRVLLWNQRRASRDWLDGMTVGVPGECIHHRKQSTASTVSTAVSSCALPCSKCELGEHAQGPNHRAGGLWGFDATPTCHNPRGMTLLSLRRAPWWMPLIAAVYVFALCFTSWVEAFGPASAGVQPAWPSLEVARVAPGSPMDQAGVQAGDIIGAVDGRAVANQIDWFVARANFERNRSMSVDVRRGPKLLPLWFTITAPDWRSWNPGTVAFRVARAVVLAMAVVVVWARPERRSAQLLALMFAMIATAEAFPPAGWASALRRLPIVLSLPTTMASVSWLFAGLAWQSFCWVFPRPIASGARVWTFVLVPLSVLLLLVTLSSIAFVYGPLALAMPSPFLDSTEARALQSTFGVIPQMFINPWPLYEPRLAMWLLETWLAVTLLCLASGFATMAINARRVRDETLRRRVRLLLMGLVVSLVLGGHNVLVRNWDNVFHTAPPMLLGMTGLVVEALVFSLLAVAMAHAVVTDDGPHAASQVG